MLTTLSSPPLNTKTQACSQPSRNSRTRPNINNPQTSSILRTSMINTSNNKRQSQGPPLPAVGLVASSKTLKWWTASIINISRISRNYHKMISWNIFRGLYKKASIISNFKTIRRLGMHRMGLIVKNWPIWETSWNTWKKRTWLTHNSLMIGTSYRSWLVRSWRDSRIINLLRGTYNQKVSCKLHNKITPISEMEALNRFISIGRDLLIKCQLNKGCPNRLLIYK